MTTRCITVAFVFMMATSTVGCGCSEDVTGNPDATDEDAPYDPLVPDGPCGDCEDGDPCTMDFCDTETMECVYLPLDMDGDGHLPIICGGGDCNDYRDDVYPGASEVCLDGIDQDCDTLVDGPMPMIEDVRVSHSDFQSQIPRIVWTGSEYCTTWTDYDASRRLDITMARLGPEGNLIDGERGPIASEAYRPSLAWTGSLIAMTWHRWEESMVSFLLLSATGEEFSFVDVLLDSDKTELVWTGSQFGLSHTTGGDSTTANPAFILLEEDGSAASEQLIVTTPVTHLDRPPSVVWTGSEFAMVWDGVYDGWANEISFARISSSGEQIGASIRLTDGGKSNCPDMTWTGSEFGLAWQYSYPDTAYFMKVDPLGNVASDPVMLSHVYVEYSTKMEVAWTGSEFGVVWMEGLVWDSTIGFALIDASGQKKYEAIQVTDETNLIYLPDMAWSGSEFGVVWTDSRDGEPGCMETPDEHCKREIYFNRIGLCD